jgi:hypothetical protein
MARLSFGRRPVNQLPIHHREAPLNSKTATGVIAITTLAAALASSSAGLATLPPTSEPGDAAPVDLSGICPETIVIQTDWWPEAEYGATYGLLGDEYEVDAGNKIVSGPLVSGGEPTGVDAEIRAGGPAVAFSSVRTLMYSDDSITIGYGSTDGQILSWEATPVVSVVAPLEINPQMIMWDPETYPDVESITDLRDQGVTVNVFQGVAFPEVFVAMGVLDADQVDPSYQGNPSRFIAADGEIAQQGFASSEPYQYENVFDDWGQPVAYELLHDAGYQPYTQNLTIRVDALEDLRPCLEALVPVVQQSAVDYLADPHGTNELIIDVVEQYNSDWTYDAGLADYAVETVTELGLIGNGPDDVIGNHDPERIETLLEQMRETELEIDEDLEAADLYTNEFIDDSIGL